MYMIKDRYHKLLIRLKTTIKDVNDLELDVYKENSNTPIIYDEPTITTLDDGSLLTFAIPFSDYEVGDVLEHFIVKLNGTHDLYDLHEHLTILVDGDESNVIKTEDGTPVTDASGHYIYVNPLEDSEFAVQFRDNKPHTVQAVYKGNNEIAMASSEKITFTPKQPTADSGLYKLTSYIPKQMEYGTVPNFKWKLTYNNSVTSECIGKVIEMILPNAEWTGWTTDSTGCVHLNNWLPVMYNWNAGEYDIGGLFITDNDGRVCETWDKIKIVKGTPKLEFYKAGKKGKTARFQLLSPQGDAIQGKDIIITVGSQTYTKKTDVLGKVYLTVNRTGTFNYTAKFMGDDNYNSVTKTANETIEN